jgi:hypothetical protein
VRQARRRKRRGTARRQLPAARGETVDFVGGGRTVHGALQVFFDGSVYRAYWKPEGSHELYVLASAGTNSTRLISTPPQGEPAGDGQPGTTLQPLNVLSCPAL